MLYPAELPGLDQRLGCPRHRWTKTPGAGKAISMDFGLAHRFGEQIVRAGTGLALRLVVACLALGSGPLVHADCGAPSGTGRVVGVDERLDIAFEDGRIVRLAGLEAPDPSRGSPKTVEAARKFLADRLVAHDVGLKLLASGLDRWGRVLADLSIQDVSNEHVSSVAIAMLSAGYARVKPEFEARSCAAAKLAIEELRASSRPGNVERAGIFRDPSFRRPRPARSRWAFCRRGGPSAQGWLRPFTSLS